MLENCRGSYCTAGYCSRDAEAYIRGIILGEGAKRGLRSSLKCLLEVIYLHVSTYALPNMIVPHAKE